MLVIFGNDTFFLNCASKVFDQSFDDVAETEATAISTPLDKVPLYILPMGEVPITLLKSSHAASISDLFSFGTPENVKHSESHACTKGKKKTYI